MLLSALAAAAAVAPGERSDASLQPANAPLPPPLRVVCVSHGTTGTHAIYRAATLLGLPSVHYTDEAVDGVNHARCHLQSCGPRSCICDESQLAPPRFPAHAQLLRLYDGLARCVGRGLNCAAPVDDWWANMTSAMREVADAGLSVADAPYPNAPRLLAGASFADGTVFVRLRRNASEWASRRRAHENPAGGLGGAPVCHPQRWNLMSRSPLDLEACAADCVRDLGANASLLTCFSAMRHVPLVELTAAFEAHEALIAHLFHGRLLDLDLFTTAPEADEVPASALAAAISARSGGGARDMRLRATEDGQRLVIDGPGFDEAGLRFRNPAQPIVVHHIPKAAGTSLLAALGDVTHDVPQPTAHAFARFEQCLSLLTTPTNFAVTMLRAPRSHITSQYTECRDDVWGRHVTNNTRFPRSATVQEDLIPWLRHFVPADSLWHASLGDFHCYCPWNMQTRALTCRENASRPSLADGTGFVGGNVTNRSLAAHADVSRAHHILEEDESRFGWRNVTQPSARAAIAALTTDVDFVGITELFSESWCLLQFQLHQRLPATGCSCDEYEGMAQTLPHERHGARSIPMRDIESETMRLIDALTEQDALVYDAGVSLLLRRLRAAERLTGAQLLCPSRIRTRLGNWTLEALSPSTIALIELTEASPIDAAPLRSVGSGADHYSHLSSWLSDYLQPSTTFAFDLTCTPAAIREGSHCTPGGANYGAMLGLDADNPRAHPQALAHGIDELNRRDDVRVFVWSGVELRLFHEGHASTTMPHRFPSHWFDTTSATHGVPSLTPQAADRLSVITFEPLHRHAGPHCFVVRDDGLETKSIAVPYPSSFHVESEAALERHLEWVRRGWSASAPALALLMAGSRHSNGPDGNNLRLALHEQCHASDRCVMLDTAEDTAFSRPELSNQAVHSELRDAVFALEPQGDTPTRSQIFEALLSGTIPVFFSACARPDLIYERLYEPFLPRYERHAFGQGTWAVVLDANAAIADPTYVMRELESIASDTERIRAMRQAIAAAIPRITYPRRGSEAATRGLGKHEPGLVSTLRGVLRERGLADALAPTEAAPADPSVLVQAGSSVGEEASVQLPTCHLTRLGDAAAEPSRSSAETVDLAQHNDTRLLSHLGELCSASAQSASVVVVDPQIMAHASNPRCGCGGCDVPNRCEQLLSSLGWQQRGVQHVIVYSYWNRWLLNTAFAGCGAQLRARGVLVATSDPFFVTGVPRDTGCGQSLDEALTPIVMPYVTSTPPLPEAAAKRFDVQLHATVKRAPRNPSGRLRASLANLTRYFARSDIRLTPSDDHAHDVEHRTLTDAASVNALHANEESMQASRLCLCPEGDTATSRRIYDALAYGCVPVLMMAPTELPYLGPSTSWDDIALVMPQLAVSVRNVSALAGKLRDAIEDDAGLRRRMRTGQAVFRRWLNHFSAAAAQGLLANVARHIAPPLEHVTRLTAASSVAPASNNSSLFIIFSRQRSGSTQFTDSLGQQPGITTYWELLGYGSGGAMDRDDLRRRVGYPTHESIMSDLPGFLRAVMAQCPTPICGFKLFDGHVRSPATLDQMFRWSPSGHERTRMIVLERSNRTAEYLSARHAHETGDWGTTPCRHSSFDPVTTRRRDGHLFHPQPFHTTEQQWAAIHDQWFSQLRALAPFGPQLEVRAEDLFEDGNATMRRALAFLGCAPTAGVDLLAPECS